jgi:hypothetical protein
MNRKGPFGFWMGMRLEEIGAEPEEVAPLKYRVVNAPKPHSAFESYILQITPQYGLSWVKAIGHTIQTSVYGIELKTAFESLERKLSAIYGKFERTDFLMPDSIWNEPRDWMQSLLNKERYLMTMWSPEHGSVLVDSLQSVLLVVGIFDLNSGYIGIEYSFENISSAEKEISAAEDESL